MPSLIDLRRRVRAVKNTQQITKAMKMVAAAKLRRAQERVVGARPYAKLLTDVLSTLLFPLPIVGLALLYDEARAASSPVPAQYIRRSSAPG